MRMIAALILAGLLAVLAYGVFWLICLDYTTAQLRDAVKEGLGADITHGTATWVPDPAQVTMDLPAVTLRMATGPVREMKAVGVRLSSGFLVRDRWRMVMPGRVDVTLANGRRMILETTQGEVQWRQGDTLTLRAEKVRMLNDQGVELAAFDDVMLRRSPDGNGVRLNLASRPYLNGVQGLLSGEVVMPPVAFERVVSLFGDHLPGLGEILDTVVSALRTGGAGNNTLSLQNVSFRFGQDLNGAVNGNVQVAPSGMTTGKVSVTADDLEDVMGWVKQAGLLVPRSPLETVGVSRFVRSMQNKHPTVTLENMQSTLMVNGNPVGQLPQAQVVVDKLWP